MTSVAAWTAADGPMPTAAAASIALRFSVVIVAIARSHQLRAGAARACAAVVIVADADRLGQHEHVARLGARVREHAVGVHGPDHRHAVLRLGVVDRVAADDQAPRFGGDARATVEHPREQLERQAVTRPGDEVERHQRRAAHRVHVGERVGRGDPPPVERVVDDRREEVGGEHEREVVRSRITAASSDVPVPTIRSRERSVGRIVRRDITSSSSAGDSLQAQPAPWENDVRRYGPPSGWLAWSDMAAHATGRTAAVLLGRATHVTSARTAPDRPVGRGTHVTSARLAPDRPVGARNPRHLRTNRARQTGRARNPRHLRTNRARQTGRAPNPPQVQTTCAREACRTISAATVRHARGGVRAPGGLPRLQSGWDGRSPSGGFDSRPPPPRRPDRLGRVFASKNWRISPVAPERASGPVASRRDGEPDRADAVPHRHASVSRPCPDRMYGPTVAGGSGGPRQQGGNDVQGRSGSGRQRLQPARHVAAPRLRGRCGAHRAGGVGGVRER